jgi:hypothetical protein
MTKQAVSMEKGVECQTSMAFPSPEGFVICRRTFAKLQADPEILTTSM